MAKWDAEETMAGKAVESYELNQGETPSPQKPRCSAPPPGFSEDGLLDHMFRYHFPDHYQLPKYATLREAARHFAKTILLNVPAGADRTAALRKVREAVMTANAGIACDGVSF